MSKGLNKLKLKAILPVASLITATAVVGTTFAWQTWDLEVKNELRSHETKVDIVEPKFNATTGRKDATFVNTGSSSVFLRVAYSEFWEVTKEGKRYTLSNKLEDGSEIAKKTWEPVWPEYRDERGNPPNNPEWTDGGDGWYYYNKILKAGMPTDPVLHHVIFDNDILTEDYKKGEYQLFFKAEVVQCSDSNEMKTLNRNQVNTAATLALFGKSPASINYETGTVTWPSE